MKCLKLCSSISALGLVSNLYLSGETKEGQEGFSLSMERSEVEELGSVGAV